MPILFLFLKMDGAKSMLGDGDTGWHIRAGEWMLANGRVATYDIFSFTKGGETWYAWEWLWDICFAWLHQRAGMAAVVAVSILVLGLTCALLFRLVRRRCDDPLIAIGVTFLACAQSSIHWLARPHLFTMFFIVVLISVLDRVKDGRPRLLITLPFLMVLWTNLHGGFFVALVILGAYTAGEVAQALFTPEPAERQGALKRAKWFLATAAACGAATFVNPYGYNLHLHIIQFFREPYHFQFISEYQSISFHSGLAAFFELNLLLAPLAAIWLLIKRRDFMPAIMVVGWAHLALFSARNIPLFAIISAPMIAQALAEVLSTLKSAPVARWVQTSVGRFQQATAEFGSVDRLPRLHIPIALAAVLLAALLTHPNATGKLKSEYDPKRYPEKALSVLRADPSARIFADDEWGDFLIYRLHPTHKVFVDGRDDFYGQDFEQKYIDVINVKYDWEQYLRSHKIDTILLSTSSALAGVIKESRNWRAIYDDTVAIVFKSVASEAPRFEQIPVPSTAGEGRDRKVTRAISSGPETTLN